jgi:uncharacterized protein with PIN domain
LGLIINNADAEGLALRVAAATGETVGDCFTYALARTTGEPLLFKGDDFPATDLQSAVG